MDERGEELVGEVAHYQSGRLRVIETQWRLDGWDTEYGVELEYGDGDAVVLRALLGLHWSASRGWRVTTDGEEINPTTEEAPDFAAALEVMARAVRANPFLTPTGAR